MTFTTSNLTGNRVLVAGTDINGVSGQTVVDSTQWVQIKAQTEHNTAVEDFDAAVEEFFGPLMEAIEKIEASVRPNTDPLSFVVIKEGSEGSEARPEHVVTLTKDSMVLRALETSQYDRLVWVNDELEILEVLNP